MDRGPQGDRRPWRVQRSIEETEVTEETKSSIEYIGP